MGFAGKSLTDPFTPMGRGGGLSSLYWSWGTDNLLPLALAYIYRHATAHRRVINDKADYISGRGITCDENDAALMAFIEKANGQGDSLRSVLNRLAVDKCVFGNAFLEVVTNRRHTFLSLYHQDATRCRLSKDKEAVILHHDWTAFSASKSKRLPLYPRFEVASDGTLRSMVHYKDYEPGYENYGLPSYVAGRGVSAIAYKTDRWNISRLDNSFQLSGVMMLDRSADSDEQAREIVATAEKKFAGTPGQVMFLINRGADDSTKFVPIESSNEGDWQSLHDQSTADIVVAHSWFRALSGLDYSTGFNPERILYEYQIALNTIIQPEQTELLEPIRNIMESIVGINSSSMQIVNRPPVTIKPGYLKVWEARKIDGLDYDEYDPAQNRLLAEISKRNENSDSAA